MKKLAIGVDDFKKLREHNAYFVDKSLFIEEVIEDISDVLLFPRPRRFGKTLNMSMLQYFFSNKNTEENRRLFDGLTITQSPVFEEHFGQYPVISLSFKSCKGQNFNLIYAEIIRIISNAFKYHKYILKKDIFSEVEIEKFLKICDEKPDQSLISTSLLLLSEYLHRYHQKTVFILIDEYDTPVHEAYLNDYYTQAIDFLRTLLGNTLKGNQHLQKGILTGILRVSKESMFSDLNNVKVYSVLSEKYNTWFGFTQGEVDKLLDDFGLSNTSSQVKDWYNGYYFGNAEIYNPWSMLGFVDSKGEFKPYWLSTSANALVHSLIKDSDKTVKKDIEDALNNTPVYSTIDENIAFDFLKNSREHILSFLVQTGYLKARYHDFVGSDRIYQIEIPNIELSKIYYTVIETWFNESIGSKELDDMLNALIANDIRTFERILSKFVLETLSYFNVGRRTKEVERVFQAFLLGMPTGLKDRYEVYSEKESGYGRFDVSVIPKDKSKQAIIMELKSIDTFNNETKDQTLEAALRQIEDRQYETVLRQQGCTNIMKIAVTFDGKRVWAKTAE
ncbi:MAG: ATP-binding protein [Bacteroidales bacterium]|nr:ATP-binding protein [Bacteroidales bacterium]